MLNQTKVPSRNDQIRKKKRLGFFDYECHAVNGLEKIILQNSELSDMSCVFYFFKINIRITQQTINIFIICKIDGGKQFNMFSLVALIFFIVFKPNLIVDLEEVMGHVG